jgi:hypothetical protein
MDKSPWPCSAGYRTTRSRNKQQEAGSVVGISVIRRLIGATCTDHDEADHQQPAIFVHFFLMRFRCRCKVWHRFPCSEAGGPFSSFSGPAVSSTPHGPADPAAFSFHGTFGVILTLFGAFLPSWHLAPISSRCTCSFAPFLFLRTEPRSATAGRFIRSRSAQTCCRIDVCTGWHLPAVPIKSAVPSARPEAKCAPGKMA